MSSMSEHSMNYHNQLATETQWYTQTVSYSTLYLHD